MHKNFTCISCELFMSLMSTSLVLHGYNILTSLVLRCEVHMNFIRTACKFVWISLVSFHRKFMRSSFEPHTKFEWTYRDLHMNKFDFVSYEVHEKFICTSYEARMKLTINFYVVQTNFMGSYGYMFSYGLYMNEPPGPSYMLASGTLLSQHLSTQCIPPGTLCWSMCKPSNVSNLYHCVLDQ